MNRNRLILRIGLIVVAVAIFFARGGQNKPDFMKGFFAALGVAVVIIVVRSVRESKQRKKAEESKQVAADGQKVDLFTKPKDF